MSARTAIVTGANAGLGLACVRALLAQDGDWHVVLAVRDIERGRAAIAELSGGERCVVMACDLAALDSVRAFAERLAARAAELPPLRALICNAGLQLPSGTHVSADGYELTFAVNHLGHFALVHALLASLAPPARIVIVSSDTHDPARRTAMPAPRYTNATQLANPNADLGGDDAPTLGRRRYTTSKLCNVLFAYELDRRLEHGARGIAVNAFNPGLMPGSGLARDYGTMQRLAWRFLMPALRVLPQVRGVRRSGRDLAALAGDARYEGASGLYFDGLRPVRSSMDSYDERAARDLWETSERLVARGARSLAPNDDAPAG